MVGVGLSAALEVRSQLVRRMARAVRIEVGEPGLLAVRARKPAEEVIEGPVLHHEHDDMTDVLGLRHPWRDARSPAFVDGRAAADEQCE